MYRPAPDSVALLQEAIASLPSEQDARSEYFIQWRNRTAQLLERIVPDDPEPLLRFKEIEFSPRRLTRDEERDERSRLDSYLAGCDAARALLGSVIVRLDSAAPAEAQPSPAADSKADSADLCRPVLDSLTRALQACETGDSELTPVLSARLLAELTVLSRDERFQSAFDRVAAGTIDRDAPAETVRTMRASAPLCVWLTVAAMNELARNGLRSPSRKSGELVAAGGFSRP